MALILAVGGSYDVNAGHGPAKDPFYMTATDPPIKAGSIEVELHPWYGSAALLEIPRIYKKIEKKGLVNDITC